MNTRPLSPVLAFLIAAVWLAGVAVMAGAALSWNDPNFTFLAALATLAVASELVDFAPFPNSRVSLSIALILAAGTLSGLPGVAVVASAAALADYAVHRKSVAKAAFNQGALLLSGAAYVGILEAFSSAYEAGDWPAVLGPALLGSVVAFVVNSGLVALAIAVEKGLNIISVWNARFRWLLPHYVLLGMLALLTALAYDRWELAGVALLLGPLGMAWLAIKQYVDHVAALIALIPTTSRP